MCFRDVSNWHSMVFKNTYDTYQAAGLEANFLTAAAQLKV